jgi:hypothetical protein
MSGIDIPIHDPDADRWVNGEISNEEWKALVLAKHRALQAQVDAAVAASAAAQQARPRRRRWLRWLGR